MARLQLSVDDASAIALKAFAFLAASEDRLERFLALSGSSPNDLGTEAPTLLFQAGVLEHLLADEPMLLEFCANEALSPDLPARALRCLQLPDR